MRYILVQTKKCNIPKAMVLLAAKALRSWWKDAFVSSLNYKVKSLTANGDRVFMEYTRTVTGEVDLQVAEVLDIKENKIIASRVYHG
jgi:hypothetical protein